MNVLHVINTLHKGGAEAHLLMLTKGLHARGVNCEVAFLRSAVAGGSVDLRDEFERAGVHTHYLACESPYDPRSATRLHRLLANRNCDILHSHLPRADAAAAVCKFLNPRQRWVSTIHGPYDRTYSSPSIGRLVPSLGPMWRTSDGVIAVSESVRRWCVERLGVSSEAIRTIVHGIELERKRVATHPDGLPATRWGIGSIGRYEEPKGHETLIRAMPAILKHFPHAHLRIAGHDPYGHGRVLRKIIADLHLEDRVHLVGFMTDKNDFFSRIEVFALASRWEGFGIVVLEAMEAGKPAVVSDIPPLMEIVTPGENGLVCPREDPESFADAIVSLFRDRDRLRCMGEEGRRRVETEYSQDRMVDRTLQYYQELANRPAVERRLRRRPWRVGTAPAAAVPGLNYDPEVVEGFGSEWRYFDQGRLENAEGLSLFNQYFEIFPWDALPARACGVDAGCGSGRWARFVAPRVAKLYCVDASAEALQVAARNLAAFTNCEFHRATVDSMPIPDRSLDFGYALGVLHHIPDTLSALRACAQKLKPGAPFLLYLYYKFENRPPWFPRIWKLSDIVRILVSRCPFPVKNAMSAVLALLVYWPLARSARAAERMGLAFENIPLSAYRDVSLYVMRTDALDRFGTRLEKRFTQDEIRRMMEHAGLVNIRFHEGPPYWVAVGTNAAAGDPSRKAAHADHEHLVNAAR